ncbi:hypothetical protein [Deinococcus hohokamensis]|uniref:Uncharacterized protein n=1 Tax=Deinococcus hohokamensis TaxID=309883 RepID=A0ABV9I9I5_9DEIO
MPRGFLQRRNTLWQALRTAEPGSADFEATLQELCALIGWDRARVLAGLGWPDPGQPEQERLQEDRDAQTQMDRRQ